MSGNLVYIGKNQGHNIYTVSYTHLDVYKRQAIGSVFGNVRESVSALIRKEKGQYRFNLYLPSERLSFDSRKEALKEAKKRLLLIVREKSIMAGCTDPHIEINSKKIYTHSFGKNKKRYVETQIVAKAEGRPDSWRS